MNHGEHEDHEDYEEHEGHESLFSPRHRMRLPSPLTPRAERVITETIGCAIRVHRALGPGFLESIYQKAMYVELKASGLSYESERPVHVKYRDVEIAGQRVDLIVEGQIVAELKAVVKLDEVHRAQLISYLRASGLRGGLLINFRVAVLRHGLRRVVL
ncbi:MAG TPA: GxxExxY protein [Vicinamibacterales bacterium]